MLKAALCGSYVNFGVFRLYGDEALDNALKTFVKLLLSIPQSDLLVSIFYFCFINYKFSFRLIFYTSFLFKESETEFIPRKYTYIVENIRV